MTTLVRTRQPLQVLSMSNQPERRYSKRLAATSVYDEQDGDFLFTRGSKRVKTATDDEATPEQQKPLAPPKRTAGRPPKAGTKRRASPPPQPPAPPPAAASAHSQNAAPLPRRTGRRRTSSLAGPAPPPAPAQDEELVVPKNRGRRKARDSADTRTSARGEPKPKPANGGVSARGRGDRRPDDEDHDDDDDDGSDGRPDLVARRTTPKNVDRRREGTAAAAAAAEEAIDPDQASFESRQIALPFSDTPIINRNKELRKKGGASGGRRSSLGMRGRRASSLIDNGHSALPHREVDPAEFYKHIEADGPSEPRRMKQLLIWCGERALSEKPPHGSHGSSAVLGARAIQDQLLKDFGARSEFSDWFSREDAPRPPVVLKPNPRNIEHDVRVAEYEAKIARLKEEKKAWQALAKPLPEVEPLYPEVGGDSSSSGKTAPDEALLDADDAKILASLTAPDAAFASFRRQTRARLQNLQSALEFAVDHLADGVHKLDQRVATAGREADTVLAASAARLRQRDDREKRALGTRDLPTMEVLRSLGRILPEGG
ncbi:Mis12-Mtw1 protein family-domain-containing protein [Lasiosphaeria miniovina]|uniref:Mis12-Mtw1 protein family-domain-containing protein n=1 Tax=Lasiosphaeria miniovina TaxID=1954250 RepID=A0AA40B6G9_9PEZI|nr:Mis12-Mtw1 protein family-domain-containing protein [Lasiosphaeria miniovina]KAK0728577.1 Mis12-Mtw1 protein family-domain-containing protein [Lasiosphaeria miniovina]